MPLGLAEIFQRLPVFVLVLFRVSGLVLAAPLFSSPSVPTQIRVLLSVAISVAVFPLLGAQVAGPITMASAIPGVVGELAIGLFVGLSVTLLLMGVELAAEAIGQQSGMRLGSVFNPMFESSGSMAAQLYMLVAMIVFLAAGGDRALIRALLESFATLPPLGFVFNEGLVELMIDLLTLAFTVTIRVGGPTLLALLLALVTLGFIGRTVPQLNILTVGFPIKLMVAILFMAMTFMSLEPVMLDASTMFVDTVRAGLGLAPMS